VAEINYYSLSSGSATCSKRLRRPGFDPKPIGSRRLRACQARN
jgi:hypothetical protein